MRTLISCLAVCLVLLTPVSVVSQERYEHKLESLRREKDKVTEEEKE